MSSTTQIAAMIPLDTLPALPDPAMLFQVSSSLTNIKDEITQGLSNIQSLREAVKSAGPDALPLPPIDDSFLLPLPGPPQPSHRHRPVPQSSSKDASQVIRPIERPRLPKSDLSDSTLEEILEKFRQTMAAAADNNIVRIEQGGSKETLRLNFGPDLGSGWVTLDDAQEGSAGERCVAKVSIFGPSVAKPSLLAVPALVPFNSVSTHLTSLRLTLNELLVRLPHLAALLKQPCFRCTKHLRLGVGPSITGMLLGEAEDGGCNVEMESSESKWVIWHPACST